MEPVQYIRKAAHHGRDAKLAFKKTQTLEATS